MKPTEEQSLSPELAELERELADRPRGEAPAGMRAGVLAGVRAELGARRRMAWWSFAGAAAAAAVLVANLAISVTLTTDYGLHLDDAVAAVDSVEGGDEDVLPGVSDRERKRQAMVVRAAAMLARSPQGAVRPAGGRRRDAVEGE
jgi:hypothetical protein